MTPEEKKRFLEILNKNSKRTDEERNESSRLTGRENKYRMEEMENAKSTPEPKKRGRPKNIMKGRAELDGNKVSAELNIKKGLEPKVKRALKKSVIAELESKMKGGRIRTISLSDSESDSESDDEEKQELKKVLKHLNSHIKDPNEKKDKRDLKQAKEIKKILSKKIM